MLFRSENCFGAHSHQVPRGCPGAASKRNSDVWESPGAQGGVDAKEALPGRHHRTSITVLKMLLFTLLPGRESLRSPTVVPLIPDQRYYGGHTVGIRGNSRGTGRPDPPGGVVSDQPGGHSSGEALDECRNDGVRAPRSIGAGWITRLST